MEKWSRVEYEVNISEDKEECTCECGQFEHTGMLCCHVLRVMEILHVEEIPAKHILKRWTNDQGTYYPNIWFSTREMIQLTCHSRVGTPPCT